MNRGNLVMPRKGDRTSRLVLRLAAAVFFVVVVCGSVTTLWRLSHWLVIDGANTVGEAGKVYFAARFAEGKSIFVTADQPPHYASMHGALLHATVGLLARIGGFDVYAMYLAGRMISMAGTVISLLCAVLILRRLGASAVACVAGVLMFFMSEAIVQHAVSYRPDHWNLALAAMACWLLVMYRKGRWRLAILMVIPVVAFFIKAPGVAIALSILLGLGVRRQWKQAAAVALGSMALLAIAIGTVEYGSDGPFIGGLRSGLEMPISVKYLLALIGEPQHWLVWILPALIVLLTLPVRDERGRCRVVVGVFFVVSFVTAAVSALRAGGGVYYFVQATLWGIVLTVAWADTAVRRGQGAKLVAAAMVVYAVLWIGPLWQTMSRSFPVTDDTPMDTAVRISRRVGADRAAIARRINAERWLCFSDDASLNILLDKPAVIYPLLAALQLQRGATMDAMIAPLREQRYDVIVLSGVVSYYLGTANLPPAFLDAVERYYVPVDTGTRYVVLMRRRR